MVKNKIGILCTNFHWISCSTVFTLSLFSRVPYRIPTPGVLPPRVVGTPLVGRRVPGAVDQEGLLLTTPDSRVTHGPFRHPQTVCPRTRTLEVLHPIDRGEMSPSLTPCLRFTKRVRVDRPFSDSTVESTQTQVPDTTGNPVFPFCLLICSGGSITRLNPSPPFFLFSSQVRLFSPSGESRPP